MVNAANVVYSHSFMQEPLKNMYLYMAVIIFIIIAL